MYKLILFLGMCSAFALGRKLPVPDKKSEKIVGCSYYSGAEVFSREPEDNLNIGNIDVSLCTHMIYSFVGLNADATINSFGSENLIKRFNDLRKKKPQLKTIVTLGGQECYAQNYTTIVTNPILRKKLVNNVVEFVKEYDFNGIDINWQFPVQTYPYKYGVVPSDKQNFVLLLKELREKFDKEGLILFATVGAIEEIAKISYDIKGISKYVNFINLITYDFYLSSQTDQRVSHNAPMYPSSKDNTKERKLNIDYVVKYWLSQGAPPSKLILGIAFAGVSFTLVSAKNHGRGAPFIETGEIGTFDTTPEYYQICPLLKDPKWTRLFDKEQQVPYIYQGTELLAYDDVESIQKKAEYAKKMNLGGAFVSTIDQDDFNGRCGEKYPLLKSLNRAFGKKF